MGVCCRPPDWEEQADEVLYRHIGAASHSLGLVYLGNFKQPDICWRDNTAGHKLSRRFLECTGNKFLLQVTEEPTRRGALLDFMLTYNEGLFGNVEVKGSLGHGDHEIVKFSVLMTHPYDDEWQAHNIGFQESRYLPLQRSAWKSPIE